MAVVEASTGQADLLLPAAGCSGLGAVAGAAGGCGTIFKIAKGEEMEQQTKFEGWAVIELFGHAREAGFVTTEYFGSGALFRVEVPALPEREVTLDRPEWVNDTMLYPGSKVVREAVQGRTRFIGPSAIYAMNPCDKPAAEKALESMTPRQVRIIEIAENKRLNSSLPGENDYDDEDYEESDQEHADVG